MPYAKRSDLPDSVRGNIPAHAQDIYKEAYNSAWEQYDQDEGRSHAVAWAAVKKQYHKDGKTGKWQKGPSKD
jgi:cation transport regulator